MSNTHCHAYTIIITVQCGLKVCEEERVKTHVHVKYTHNIIMIYAHVIALEIHGLVKYNTD